MYIHTHIRNFSILNEFSWRKFRPPLKEIRLFETDLQCEGSGDQTEIRKPQNWVIEANGFFIMIYHYLYTIGSCMVQAVRRSPPTAALESRVPVSVSPYAFRRVLNGFWVGFSRGFSRFPPCHKFHSTISAHSLHSFRVISFHVVVRKAWSADVLTIHRSLIKGVHRILSLEPALCGSRVEGTYFYKQQIWTMNVL